MARSWFVKKCGWWKHMKWYKRPQQKRERQHAKKEIKNER